jgi:hypothetical protein
MVSGPAEAPMTHSQGCATDDFVVLVQGTQQDAEHERQALAQFLIEELRIELSMEKTSSGRL